MDMKHIWNTQEYDLGWTKASRLRSILWPNDLEHAQRGWGSKPMVADPPLYVFCSTIKFITCPIEDSVEYLRNIFVDFQCPLVN
jgi:hypothetical protein